MSSDAPNRIETIICLANSRKISGRCIAGKRLDDYSWFRPISSRPGHEISELDRRYADGKTAQILEIINIPCVESRPCQHQSENVLIDDRFYWEKKGRASWENLLDLIDQDSDLWINGYSAYYNRNNRLPQNKISEKDGSLRLILLDEIIIHAGPKAPHFGDMKQVVRASFQYQGQQYKLDVTDPECERFHLEKGAGEYSIHSAVACISLSEPHTNQNGETFVYKLVASIITPKRAQA